MKNKTTPTGNQNDQWQLNDVIVAVSSPVGQSTRAVIRVSGNGALEILRKTERVSAIHRRGIFFTTLFFAFGELPALVIVMPGPNSYTGEDSFELLVPGNPHLVQMIVSEIVRANNNVRRAGPGEYSLRAFLSGKLTLEQVEGVAATISARTDAELRAAEQLRKGTLGHIAARLLEALADMLALVEAGIDFTDQEDVVAISPAVLCAGLRAALHEMRNILNASIPMEHLECAPWVVLTGNTNAGKSALMNALLQQDRAVVTNQAGTTRDALVEPWVVPVAGGNLEVLLVDSPGFIGDFTSELLLLDQLGQEARAKAIEHATLIVRCHAVGAPVVVKEGGATVTAGETAAANEIIVVTKCDLLDAAQVPSEPSVLDHFYDSAGARRSGATHMNHAAGVIYTSAKNKIGLKEFAHAVGAALSGSGISNTGQGMALAQRHRALLAACVIDLQQALAAAVADESCRHLRTPELVASAMHSALENLGGIAGRMTPDDILGRIFSRFCVGK
ncbi:MAG: hypothetical protein EXS12_01520 [Phycisphaerales bacterium]|nr:hypothetical protein [Phycisphaerales bacterium]